MRFSRTFAAATFAFSLLSSLTATAVIRGTRAPVESTKATVFILNEQTNNICTGTVIHPRLILTAGHCVLGKETNAFSFANSASVPDSGRRLKIQKAEARTGYCRDIKGVQAAGKSGADVAYFLFADSILPALGLTQADLPDVASTRESLMSAVTQARDFELIGYGLSSKGNMSSAPAKLRYSLTATLEDDDTLIRAKGVTPGQSSCFGDSGGPLFAIDGASRKTLVGVLTAIKAGGALAAKHSAEQTENYNKAKEKLLKKGINPESLITYDANGCKSDPLAAKSALSPSDLLQVCGDKDTSQVAASVYPHLCWIQAQTHLILDPNLKCTGDAP